MLAIPDSHTTASISGREAANVIEFAPEFDALREAHHRITNNLSLIAGFVRLQAASVNKRSDPFAPEEAWLLLEDIAGRIETVGRLHRLLALRGAVGEVNLGDYLRETCEALVQSLAPAGELRLTTHFRPGCHVGSEQILPMALIVTEVMVNSIKYAHPAGVAGQLSAGCWVGPDGKVVIQVEDDGVGLPEGFDAATDGGLGLRIIRSLADQLGAEWDFQSEGLGLRFTLRTPSLRS